MAGDWHSKIHEEPVFNAFVKLGHNVSRFSWHQYFELDQPKSRFRLFITRCQNKFLTGPLIAKLNRDFLANVLERKPDVVFIYRGTHILPETLREIKRQNPRLLLSGYNNDDPFARGHPYWLWKFFIHSIPLYDTLFCYRPNNIREFQTKGAARVHLLMPWYNPEVHHPMELNAPEKIKYGCDVVFVGHHEPDDRAICLKLIERERIKLKIHGPGWEKSEIFKKTDPIRSVWGDEYSKALCGGKIALSFFSTLNRDVYTRRSFEIPATGTFMLSKYSQELSNIFKPGVEADFFQSKEEMLEKIKYYLSHDEERKRVARAGLDKVRSGGHDVISRAQNVLKILSEELMDGNIKKLSEGA